MKIWSCKIGEVDAGRLPQGADLPMRQAVEAQYQRLTGQDSIFLFSGWDAELTEGERAVVEDRMPREQESELDRLRSRNEQLEEALQEARQALVECKSFLHYEGTCPPGAAREKAEKCIEKIDTLSAEPEQLEADLDNLRDAYYAAIQQLQRMGAESVPLYPDPAEQAEERNRKVEAALRRISGYASKEGRIARNILDSSLPDSEPEQGEPDQYAHEVVDEITERLLAKGYEGVKFDGDVGPITALVEWIDEQIRSESRVPEIVWSKLLKIEQDAPRPFSECACTIRYELDRALAQSEQGRVPEGWKLVPVEPTEEMIDVKLSIAMDRVQKNGIGNPGMRQAAIDDYKAMLAAAPQPDTQEGEGDP